MDLSKTQCEMYLSLPIQDAQAVAVTNIMTHVASSYKQAAILCLITHDWIL